MLENYIKSKVEETFIKAENIFDRKFSRIKIKFDLKNQVAGMYCYKNFKQNQWFRFNLEIFKLNPNSFDRTIIHEVAHYIVSNMSNPLNLRYKPHGREWKNIMIKLGVTNPKVTHNLKCPENKKSQKFEYNCNCQTHLLSKTKHNRIQTKGINYFCVICKTKLILK